MEVETWPPLVDEKLGLRGRSCSPELGLAIAEDDIPSEEERDLLRSPDRDEEGTNALVNGGDHEKSSREDNAMCNGDVSSETVSDAKCVFRTGNDCETVRAKELSGKNAKKQNVGEDGTNDSICTEGSVGGENGLTENSTTREDKTDEQCSVGDSSNATELRIGEAQTLGDAEETGAVNGVGEDENLDACREVGDDELLQGLSPKSLKDYDDLDDMEIPQVIDISSIGVTKDDADDVRAESNDDSAAINEDDLDVSCEEILVNSICTFERTEDSSNMIEGGEGENAGLTDMEVSAAAQEHIDGESVPDAIEGAANAGDNNDSSTPAEEEHADNSVDFDQAEEGSPEYQGMTDDILPIIESELDDMPVGEGNIFDTEVECDDGTSIQEDVDDNDESSCPVPSEIEVEATSPQVSANSQAANRGNKEREGCSTTKDFNSQFPPNESMKRRRSVESAENSPSKVLKRHSSLDSSESSGTLKTPEGFKKLSTTTISDKTTSAPLDVPLDIVEHEADSSPTPAKRRKTADFEPQVAASSTSSPIAQPKEKVVKPGNESVLVIDLDDDDEDEKSHVKPPADCPAMDTKSSTKEPEEPRSNGPRSALDILFNGKEEITLNKKMFSKILKSAVSQYLSTFSEFGKATSVSLKASDVLGKIQSNVSSFEKQKEDFKSIMNKLIDDRQAKKTWDENLMPPRSTRSVGLQYCSVGSMYVKAEDTLPNAEKAKLPGSINSQSQSLAQQKQAYAQQKLAFAQSRAHLEQTQTAQQNTIRPIARKSVTPTNRSPVIRKVPISKPVTPIKSKQDGLQFLVTSPKLNGLKAVTLTRNPEPSLSNAPMTVATALPNSRTYAITNKGTVALKSPTNPSTPLTSQFKQSGSVLLTKALTSIGAGSRSTNVVPKPNLPKTLPVSFTPGTVQNTKNLVSGPGRPGKPGVPVSPNILSSALPSTKAVNRILHDVTQLEKGKKPAAAADATIDLTDDDGPPTSKPAVTPRETSTARKSTAPSRVSIPSKSPTNNKPMRHPALPPNPPDFNPSSSPPRPSLGICNTQTVTQGIMLTWHFNNISPLRPISKFQVYAYQESKGDGEDAWKKVGDVDALPLPMACTLTQFREGYTYHFIVRAVDEAGRIGPFSAPNTITLMKKTV